MTLFGRYSFVDTLTFRPAPLEGLAEGSFNDAFGANDMRSQGLALGLTWTVSPTLVGDIRFGYSRGDYYTTPPNFGVDGPAAIGLKNVPSDPAIMGGVPKVNMQGFDAVGRHTSTPQFQTPRSWNPRATFSLSRGAHFLKFGGEFLHVQTRINDLNATIGRMNFENRFTNRAVGDLLLGLPSQLALTSYTVMDQGQDMQFYFLQDDYRIYAEADGERRPALRVRHASARAGQSVRQLRSGDRDDDLCDRRRYLRARVDSSRPEQLCTADRVRVPRRRHAGSCAAATACSTRTPSGRGAKDCSVSTRPTWSTTCCRPASRGRRPWPRRRRSGWSTAIHRVCSIRRRCLRPSAAGRRTPISARPTSSNTTSAFSTELMPDVVLDVAYVGNKGTKLNGFRNLNQRAVITNADGSQSAGARPYPAFGDIQWMENRVRLQLQLAAAAAGETVHPRADREHQLHARRGAERRARSHLDERRRRGHRHRRVPRAPGRQQPSRRVRALRVRRAASVRGQLHLGTAVRPRPALGQRLGTARWISRSADGR